MYYSLCLWFGDHSSLYRYHHYTKYKFCGIRYHRNMHKWCEWFPWMFGSVYVRPIYKMRVSSVRIHMNNNKVNGGMRWNDWGDSRYQFGLFVTKCYTHKILITYCLVSPYVQDTMFLFFIFSLSLSFFQRVRYFRRLDCLWFDLIDIIYIFNFAHCGFFD